MGKKMNNTLVWSRSLAVGVAMTVSTLLLSMALSAAPASAAFTYPLRGEMEIGMGSSSWASTVVGSLGVNGHNGDLLVPLIEGSTAGNDPSEAVLKVFNPAHKLVGTWTGAGTPPGSFTPPPPKSSETSPTPELNGIVADSASGRVYLAYRPNIRAEERSGKSEAMIDVFASGAEETYLCQITGSGEASTSASECDTSAPGVPGGTFTRIFSEAVDQATGDLYVFARTASGDAIDRFDSSGKFLSQLNGPPLPVFEGRPDGLAIDDVAGKILLGINEGFSAKNEEPIEKRQHEIEVFSLASGEYLETWDGSAGTNAPGVPQGKFGLVDGLMVNESSGDVYVIDGDLAVTKDFVVDRLSPGGEYLDRLTGVPGGESFPIGSATLFGAVEQATGDLYLVYDVNSHKPKVADIFGGEPVLAAEAKTTSAAPVTARGATLNGEVDPEGLGLSECYFEYGATKAYGRTAPCKAPAAGEVPADSAFHIVHAEVEGLKPGVEYHFRLRVANANAPSFGQDQSLETLVLPRIEAEEAVEVAEATATVQAQVNPQGPAVTSCQIEWGASTSYGHAVPCEPPSLPAGIEFKPIVAHLSGLSGNTTYHWRVVAGDENGSEASPDNTFVFLPPPLPESCPANEEMRTGPSAALPDCRAYELVTPAAKNGARVPVPAFFFTLPRHIGAAGSRIVDSTVQCFAGAGGCNADRGQIGNFYAFTRTTAGWQAEPMGPAVGPGSADATPWIAGAEPQSALVSMPSPTIEKEQLYSRVENGPWRRVGPVLAAGEEPRVPGGFTAATADLSHIVFSRHNGTVVEYVGSDSADPLQVAVTGGKGSTDLVSTCGASLPERNSALSTDGKVAYFTAVGGLKCSGTGANAGTEIRVNALYARVEGETEGEARTVAISQRSSTECSGECASSTPAPAEFLGASNDGSRVLFSSKQQLTDAATQGSNNLYLFQNPAEQPLSGHNLLDVSAGDSSGEGPGVQGVLAVSADGSHVYFVAEGVLAGNEGAATDPETGKPEQAEPGADNLYLYQRDAAHPAGQVSFLGALPSADADQWIGPPQDGLLADVTPSGRYLVFASHASLTPDATHPGIAQIYRFDAQTGTLARLSAGERGFNNNGNSALGDAGIAVPLNFDQGAEPLRGDPTMSDDGSRVFFQSPAALVPGALDNVQVGIEGRHGQEVPSYANNIYEWEENGTGTCVEPPGCVRLISDGADTVEFASGSAVQLLGSDASGANVFFTSGDQLVEADNNTGADEYDARVDGGFPESAEPEPCASSEACRGQGTSEGSPASPGTPGFGGPEEGPAHPLAPKPCRKGQVRRHGRCVKHKQRKHQSHHKKRQRGRAAGGEQGGSR